MLFRKSRHALLFVLIAVLLCAGIVLLTRWLADDMQKTADDLRQRRQIERSHDTQN